MDIILSENLRAAEQNPDLFTQKTVLYHGAQNPASISDVADLKTQIYTELPSSDLKTDVSIVKPVRKAVTSRDEPTVPEIFKSIRSGVQSIISPAPTSNPIIEAIEMPELEAQELQEELENDEIPVTIELPLELLIKEDHLTTDNLETLLKYLQESPNDERLWTYIKKIAHHPVDAQVIGANLADLNTDLLDSILIIGSHQDTFTDDLTGETKQIFLYGGHSLAEGGLGEVAEVSYVLEGNLQLKHSLIKIPLVETLQRNLDYLFVLEAKVGNMLRRLASINPHDPRLKHILIPEIITDRFMLIPKIINEKGESKTLSQIISRGKPTLARFAKTLSGMASGLSFLSEYDIIAIDNKDSNYMESADRGSLIDLGGFLPMDTYKTGEVGILPLNDGSECPIFQSTGQNVPFTPEFSNFHLISQELKGAIPNDVTHKLTMARVIEKYLVAFVKKPVDHFPWKLYGNLKAIQKLDHPPLDLANTTLPPAESLLYQLYLSLYNSHKHPFRFKQNDLQQGIDPEYITLSMAEDILLEISSM